MEAELNMMSAMISDKDNTISTLNLDIEIKLKEIDNNQIMISKFETENCAHNVEIDKLTENNVEYDKEIKVMEEKIHVYESSIQSNIKEIKDLNNLILERDSSVLSLKSEIESSSNLTSKLYTDLEGSRQSCVSLQNTTEELKSEIESIQVKNHDTMSQLESTKLNYENEIVLLRQDIGDKQSQIAYMENQIDLDNQKREAEQQAIISNNSEQLTALQQNTYDLGSKLSELHLQLDEKETEIISLKANLDERTMEYSEASAKLTENHEQIVVLTNDLADNVKIFENLLVEKENFEYEKNELLLKIDDLNLKLSHSESSAEKLSEQVSALRSIDSSNFATERRPSEDPISISSDQDQLYYLRSECENISQEKYKLEKELLEAQQAIVRLETSLATQSTHDDASKDSWNEWGDVDLGQKNQLEPSLQTTLTEKDRVLTMTQEQLKDALEQVNTVVDDKKLIEQQMRVLEAELNHKEEKIEAHVEEIKRLELSMQNLEERSVAFDDQVQMNENPVDSGILQQEPQFELEHLQSPVLHDPQTSDEVTESHHATAITTSSPVTVSMDVEESSHNAASLEDLQYKLIWYEEMWPQWTETYNQMCSGYQTAQEQVSLLQSQLNDAQMQLHENDEVLKAESQLTEESLKETKEAEEHQNETRKLQNQVRLLLRVFMIFFI
ncbi:MAG: hypothetical protein O6761_05040 [Thaumarchaeota archaeon]|nr:hypothetical protein [Nitrososphaerota archaeon]